jgi:hypothetical protein
MQCAEPSACRTLRQTRRVTGFAYTESEMDMAYLSSLTNISWKPAPQGSVGHAT